MQLQEAQKQKIREWVQQGCNLSEIQKRMAGELSLPMTFIDVRLLVLELGLSVQDKVERKKEEPKKPEPKTAFPPDEEEALDDDNAADPLAGGSGGVSVQVDRIVKPGTMVSGSVTFSDGVTAQWGLDQMGRLMLQASKPGYKPSEKDVHSFQRELQTALSQKGF